MIPKKEGSSISALQIRKVAAVARFYTSQCHLGDDNVCSRLVPIPACRPARIISALDLADAPFHIWSVCSTGKALQIPAEWHDGQGADSENPNAERNNFGM